MQLNSDQLYEYAQYLDYPSLVSLCSAGSYSAQLCRTPRFRDLFAQARKRHQQVIDQRLAELNLLSDYPDMVYEYSKYLDYDSLMDVCELNQKLADICSTPRFEQLLYKARTRRRR